MANTSGFPGVNTTITDLSIVLANLIQGIWCVQVITKRGVPGREYLIGNKSEFFRVLGQFNDPDLGVEMCIIALENKAVLRVTPARHYTDPTDISTIVGVKATTIGASGFVGPITGNSEDDGAVDQDYFQFEFDQTQLFLPGATFVMAGSTGNDGTYTVDFTEFSGGETLVHTLESVDDAALDGEITLVATASFEAEAVGSGYNGTTLEIKASKSGNPANVDLIVNLFGSNTDVEVLDIKAASTSASDIEAINAVLEAKGIKLLSVTNNLSIGVFTFAGGVHDDTTVVPADYNGDANAKTGWHAFDGVTDSFRIINLNAPVIEIDFGLIAYVEGRRDMRAALRTPLGLTVDGLNAYLDGTTPFSHTPANSLYASYWYTDVEINDKDNPEVLDKEIAALGHYMGKRSQKDQLGVWLTAAGEGSEISKINQISINFGSPGNKTQADILYEKGLNFIIKDEALGVVPWGNRNTLKDKTKLTSKDNIADLVVHISNVVKAIAKKKNFKPNDFIMFNELYRSVLPFIYTLIDGRAIQGEEGGLRGEGKFWHWLGDQFARNNSELTFNTPGDVDVGIYRVRFAFKPIASNEFIVIDIAPADSVTILNVQVLTDI